MFLKKRQGHNRPSSSLKKSQHLKSFAPGRLEILGNHTDYNCGYVLSMAVQQGTTIHWTRQNQELVELKSSLYPNVNRTLHLSHLSQELEKNDWLKYIQGLLLEIQKTPKKLEPFKAHIHSDLPISAGMSSSASLEMSFLIGINQLFQFNFNLMKLALLGQACENNHLRANTGLMDQLTVLFSKRNHLLLSEYQEHQLEHLSFPNDFSFVVIDSHIVHDLSDEYSTRRNECDLALLHLKKQYPFIHSLRDLDLNQLEAVQNKIPLLLYKRASHIVSENERVRLAKNYLQQKDFVNFGQLLFESHESSRMNFENSCPELDELIQLARDSKHCLGARLSGGGFGGVSIHLVHVDSIKEYSAEIQTKCRFSPRIYVCQSEDGARVETSI